MTFLYSIYHRPNWAVLLVQLMGSIKLNPASLAFPRRSPSLCDCHLKNRITSSGARTTASVMCSSRPSWNISAINEPLHVWKGGGWLPSPSPRVTLIWTQYHIWSSWAGWSCWCSGIRDHLEGNWVDCINLKGVLEEAPICNILSSNESISSLRLWATSPVSLASPLWDEGVEEAPFWAASPPQVDFYAFPWEYRSPLPMPSHYSYPVHWITWFSLYMQKSSNVCFCQN